MPLTSLSVSSYDFSGQIRPSKPSGMPITFHLYLRKAHLTAARMTALRPGASPPPVQMPIQRISGMVMVHRRGKGRGAEFRAPPYDNSVRAAASVNITYRRTVTVRWEAGREPGNEVIARL